MRIDKIIIKGQKQGNLLAAEPSDTLEIKETYLVGAATRAVAERHTIDLGKEDIVEFVFEDNTVWLSNADTIQDIFPEANLKVRSVEGGFEIPSTVQPDGATRSIAGNVAIKIIKIFSKTAVSAGVRELAERLEKTQLENRSGLYRLDAGFQFSKDIPAQSDKPYLLFLHGTASSTNSSFDKLVGSDTWKYIHATYGRNVLAFQHETLTKSPLQNVFELVQQLPSSASLHLISHSRGGLVGDVLSRFCVDDEHNLGFSDDEIRYLEKCDRKADVDYISKIKQEIANRNITVKKFIRVACPASGTTLASQRLDYFFNISFNLIGLATGGSANPAYMAFKALASSVVNCKNDENTLPGLEAMNPDSPFLKVLNNPRPAAVIDSPLMVISGNSELSLSFKALIVIASKFFFTSKNDFVVNTESMYNGAKRTRLAQYFFDQGSDVNHFNYFANSRTSNVILLALQAQGDTLIPGFTRLEQGAVAAADRNALLNLEGGAVFKDTVTGKRPIVVLLPGIMGSNLSVGRKNVWINYLRFLAGDLFSLNMGARDVSADSLIKTSYGKIADYLSETYDVVTFPFDWRQQLNDCAHELNKKITKLLDYGQPIKVIGHSMGGVLVRDFMIQHPATWQKLNNSFGFKLIFLGSPLGGSFRIPYVLFGKDVLIDKLAKIDIFHSKKDLLSVFSSMPGLLSLLPVTDDAKNDFSKEDTWKKMSAASGDPSWPVPNKAALTQFGAYRDAINKGMPDLDFSNAIYIAGKDKATPNGYEIDENKNLVFMSTGEGDQSVTWESGIPKKMIEQNSVYYVDVTHGALACEPSLFKGIAEILEKGSTSLFKRTRPVVRGNEKDFVTPEVHDFDLSPEGVENSILGLGAEVREVAGELPIRVSVTNGDLRFSSFPLLAGHFLNDGILYAERAIDANMQGALSERHQLGLYPGAIGTSETLLSCQEDFNGAIIVGLGAPGALTAYQLTQTVEQGICKFLLNINTKVPCDSYHVNVEKIGISTLPIGCGYGGLTIENSVRAILLGVQNANNRMRQIHPDGTKTVQFVEFVEQYKDRALSCFYSLNAIEKDEDKTLNIVNDKRKIKTTPGSKDRLPIENMDEWWTRINVQLKDYGDGSRSVSGLQFNISTGGAREEQRDLYTNRTIIQELINDLSVNNAWTPQLAKTIFELMVPNDFKEQLKKQANISWIVDKDTAVYPWEMLQDSTNNANPLSINAGMVRQLATQDYRTKINTVSANTALVIGDPDLKGFTMQLPGAEQEGIMVSEVLQENGLNVTTILKGSAPEIIQALFSSDYKIIHLAGHGLYSEDPQKDSGMLIGNNVFLSTLEIAQMSSVPEFVFVNCCHLGRTDGIIDELYRNRYKLAANIGTQLIDNGVKAVIAAGWAVDDAAALEFTELFYRYMYEGYKFGEAVQQARKVIYNKYPYTNTWGAYQCYGDQFYSFVNTAGKVKEKAFVIAEEAEVDLTNLINKLDIIGYAPEYLLQELNAISNAVDNADIRTEKITELEALVYSGLCIYDQAITKYEGLLSSEHAGFSFAAMEKYCNVRAKQYITEFKSGVKKGPELLQSITKVIDDLQGLLYYNRTAERLNLLGSTYKRKTILSHTKAQKIKALADSALYYYQAYTHGKTEQVYSLTNWLGIENLLVLLGTRKWGETITVNHTEYTLPTQAEAVTQLHAMMDSVSPTSQEIIDYWDIVALANIKLCLLLLDHKGTNLPPVTYEEVYKAYQLAWRKAGSRGKKLLEVEHLEFLSEILSMIDVKKVSAATENIELLKNTLSRLM